MWSFKFIVAWLMLVLFAMPAHANISISTRDTIWSANCVAETVTLPFCRQGAGATLAAYRAVAGTYTAFSAGGGGGGDAMVADPLSQFASTTSAQLAGVLSNETGTGLAVFATAPTFTTSITDPLLYGSSANTGTLTLASTSHGTPTTDAIIFQSGGVESGRIATFTSALDAATGERWLLQSPGWPGTYANQAYSMLRIDMLAQSGKANSALQVFLRDGTGDGIVTSFGSDSAAIQAWCTSEGAADSGNTTVCMNVGSVFSRKTLSGTIGNFTLEFDMQNYNQTCSSIIDPECGIIQKMVVHGNQPVTAFGIMRDFDVIAAKVGWIATGVRDTFLYLTPSTTTGQTTVDIVRGITSGDTFYRHIQSYQGAMQWGPGTTATDVQTSRTAVGALTVTSDLNSLTNTQVLRQTSNVSANDAIVASLGHFGKDSTAAAQQYSGIDTYIRDNTATSEDSEMYFNVMVAGALTTQIAINSAGATFTGMLTAGSGIVRIPSDGAGVFLDNGSYGFGIYRSGTTVHLLAGAIATPTVSLDANGFRGASLPASQTIASGNTVTADACGSVKRITAAGAVTTSTTDTFTAPAAGNSGCEMTVCNVGTNVITLDNNANFSAGGITGALSGTDVALGADDCVPVVSTGASGKWFQAGAGSSNG